MHAFDRRTDGQTDKQTDGHLISSVVRDGIPCSEAKMLKYDLSQNQNP